MRAPVSVAALALALLGCAAEAAPPAPAAAPAATTPAAAVPAGPRGVVLSRYEALRTALADDRADGLAADVDSLRAAALELVAAKGAGAAEGLKGADALVAVTKAAPVDLKAARLAFGELSRGVVAVVAADTALQVGRFLFECPMAKGYQRWVQLAPSMMNPYMGKRMLECGSPVEAWRVEG